MARKFPNVIHVTREGEDTREEYLAVREGGADNDTTIEKTTPVAVYKLVEVGEVRVTRAYQPATKTRRR